MKNQVRLSSPYRLDQVKVLDVDLFLADYFVDDPITLDQIIQSSDRV